MAQAADPYSIPYSATSDDYGNVAKLADAPLADRVKIEVYNAAVAFQLERDRQWQPEERTGPWVGTLLRAGINGIRFRSLVAGTPAVVSAAMDYDLGADVGIPPSFNVSTAGVVRTPVSLINGLTGSINADGTIAAGSGFTITKLGVGTYRINFAAGTFAAPPIVVLTPMLTGGGGNYALPGINTVAAASCVLNTVVPATQAVVDSAFHFIAIAAQ